MADESSFHTLIVHKKPIEIEVLEGSPMYFKIAVKEQLSPLKFTLFYKDGDGKKAKK